MIRNFGFFFVGILFSIIAFILFINIKNYVIQNQKIEFVEITESEYNVILDIRYATKNNFAGKVLYKTPAFFLPIEVAEKIKIISQYANGIGYKLKLFDGFRPLNIQRELFKAFPVDGYVSDPDKGAAGHTRGIAIDLTLVDMKTNKELDMGTEFDSLKEESHCLNPNLTQEQKKNRMLLVGLMARYFTPLPTEWWHFNFRLYDKYPDYDSTKFKKRIAQELNLEARY